MGSGPDLIESTVGDPPATANLGDIFTASDTVTNQGNVDAAATVTAYYLSTDKSHGGADPKLGTRNVGAVAIGAMDAGSASVTIPAVAAGAYYVIACADSTNLVAESVETNNCTASTDQVTISGADLVETMVSDPPANLVSGTPFTISDTVQNNGTVAAGASTTHYYVSLDAVHVAPGTLSIGSRAVGAIAATGTDSGSATVATPGGTPQGTYYILACADRPSVVPETNENNNCIASAGTMVLSAPDLVESDVMVTPSPVDANAMLSVTETATNNTATAAGDSVTRFQISVDGSTSIGWIRNCVNGGLTPGRDIPSLAGGAQSTGTTSFALCFHEKSTNTLKQIPVGTYYMIACADDTDEVAETNETNNCAYSASTFTVSLCGDGIIEAGETCDDGNTVSGDGCSSTCQIEAAADLIESSVSDPPGTATTGGMMPVSDTVTNISAGETAGASTTKYYLSLDRVKSGGDPLLTGSRAVPTLVAGANSAGSATVTVPSVTAGSYYLIACADANNVVPETNETNNCTASVNRVTISGADLIESMVSDPPAALHDGDAFTEMDTVTNQGSSAAGASQTDYYVSLDGVHVAMGTVVLGTRAVGAIAAGGGTNSGTGNLKIAGGTPQGTYYILACADRTNLVAETNENNNCQASVGQVVVTGPDLTESNVAVAPTSVTVGGSVVVMETVTDATLVAAGASTTRFYISTDMLRSTGDLLLRNCATGTDIKRAVPALPGSGTSVGTTTVPLCYHDTGGNHSVAAGTYWVLACADDGGVVPEANENNNCTASATQLTITP